METPARTFGFTIKTLSNQLKRMHDKSAIADNTLGLTGMQFAVLGFIAYETRLEHRDVFQRDIEKEFDIRRSSATSVLQLMERNGVLRREGVPGDLRLKRIVLTEEGLAAQERDGQRIQQTEAMLTEGIAPEDLAAFYRATAIASQNIKKYLHETDATK